MERMRDGGGRLRLALGLIAGAAVVGPLLAGQADAATWYVDGRGGKQSNPGSIAAPFQFVWQGLQAAKPGDTVLVEPTIVYPFVAVMTSGTAAKPITLAGGGSSPNLTKIVGNATNFAVWVDANYVVVRNFDLSAPGAKSALHVASGIHHVTVADNVAHDSGGGGISTIGNDYLTISHNIVYGNSFYTANHVYTSGISLLGPLDTDANTGVKMLIDGNVVYGNTNRPPCTQASCLTPGQDSDGNGIIVDDTRRSQRDHVGYRGRTMISNNVVFGNGGRGIHIYLSDHVTATSNTVYGNNQDPYEGNYRPGEIEAIYASDVAIYNNVLFSDGGTGLGGGTGTHVPLNISYCTGAVGVTAQNNLGYNPANNQVFFFGQKNTAHIGVIANVWANPQFSQPSLNPAVADFRPRPGSTALIGGNALMSPAADIMGAARGMSPAIGAYQNAAANVVAARH